MREEVDSRTNQLGTEEQAAGCFLAAFEVLFLFTTVNQGNNLFPREDSLLERSPRLKDRFSNWASAEAFATSNLLSFDLKLKL